MLGEFDRQLPGERDPGGGNSWSKSPRDCVRNVTGADVPGSVSEGERAGEEGGQRGTQHLLMS